MWKDNTQTPKTNDRSNKQAITTKPIAKQSAEAESKMKKKNKNSKYQIYIEGIDFEGNRSPQPNIQPVSASACVCFGGPFFNIGKL